MTGTQPPPDRDDRVELASRIGELEREVLELRNLDAAKSHFLANVSHELRTPLTAVVTYGEVLRDELLGELTPKQKEAVGAIISSTRQLLSMIEEVLTYARANTRAAELELVEFAVEEVIADAHAMNASLLGRKRLGYSATGCNGLPAVRADRDKVLHVLGNLLGNAIEFTLEGGHIEVRAARHAPKPGWLEVAVEDSGIGIDPTHHAMIFEEFAQVDSSRARVHHGTGLGLSIARNFVRLHGGEIWVESSLGEGSRFYFTLPSVEAAAGGRVA
ncbi:MAG: sensor histidine kinase [Longimicrobiaceae bacterium]